VKNLGLAIINLLACVMLAPLPAFAQNAPARVVSSIDMRVLTADSVVAGRIARAVPGQDGSVNISSAERTY
jgi:hypothetical protein